jgi:15-cis-phytoene synthase
MTPDLPAILARVRTADPDAWLAALFAPPEARTRLLLIAAFDHELARAADMAAAGTGLIRLQWWRDTLEGPPRRHELATPLHAELDAGRLPLAPLLGMIDGRERETSLPTQADWTAWCRDWGSNRAEATARALIPDPPPDRLDTLRHRGAALAATWALRNTAALARRGRCLLPTDRLTGYGLSPDAVIEDPQRARTLLRLLAAETRAELGPPVAWPRTLIAAALPATLARRDLRRDPSLGFGERGLGDRLALVFGGLAGWA